MQSNSEELLQQRQSQLGDIRDALNSGAMQSAKRVLKSLAPVEIAHLVESSPPPSRWLIWELIPDQLEGEVLQELSYDIQSQILRRMDTDKLVDITDGLDPDDTADILQQLPDRVMQEVLNNMDVLERQRVESVLSYDEDTAGGLMNTDIIMIRARLSLEVVLRYLRWHEELPPSLDNLIVVNSNGEYVGLLPITKLLTSSPSMSVREVMLTDVDPIPVSMDESEVASLFEKFDWISAPVVDENNLVLGRITIDDVVDVIREGGDHSLMSLAGLDEDADTFASVRRAAPA